MIPIDDLKRCVLAATSGAFLRTHFGEDWFRCGAPRTVLTLSLEELLAFARVHGIFRAVLTEDCWTGDDHFVIDKRAAAEAFSKMRPPVKPNMPLRNPWKATAAQKRAARAAGRAGRTSTRTGV